MYTWLIASLAGGGFVVLTAYYLLRHKIINNEIARKIIHIAHGLTVASWPYSVSYEFIIAAEALFIAVVLTARQQALLPALRKVERRTWGEVFFGLAIILLALFEPSSTAFLVALLHLGLADGMATIVGQHLKSKQYNVFGQRKSIAGTATFFLTSLGIIAGLAVFSNVPFTVGSFTASLILVPILTTLAENVSPYGSDNLTIPLLVIALAPLLT